MEINPASHKLKLVIIGANGGTGRQAVTQALGAGHHVTAILRTPSKLNMSHPNLETVQGDVTQPSSFEHYLVDKDAVISALGEFNREPTTLYSRGTKNILDAMKKAGVKRIISISASAIEISPANSFLLRLATKYIVQKLFGNGYADQRIMESILKASKTDWTIMRPPRLLDKPVSGRYRFAINNWLKNCMSISRADLAHFMVNHISDPATYRAVIEIAY